MVTAEMPFIERRCFCIRLSEDGTIGVYGELVWRWFGGEWDTWFRGKLGGSRSLGGGFGLYRRSVWVRESARRLSICWERSVTGGAWNRDVGLCTVIPRCKVYGRAAAFDEEGLCRCE